jgi:hypothetical protein
MTRVERLEEEFTTTTAREHRKELGIGTIIEKKVRKARENKRKNSPFQMMSFFIFTEQDFSISAIASTRNDKEKNYARTFFTTFFDPVVLTEIIFRPLYSPVIGEAKCERAVASPLSLYWSETRFLRRFALRRSHAAYRFLLRTFESCCGGEIVIKERLI